MRGTRPMPVYFPGPDERWERRAPERVGIDPDLLAAAVEFVQKPHTGGAIAAALRRALGGAAVLARP